LTDFADENFSMVVVCNDGPVFKLKRSEIKIVRMLRIFNADT